MSREGSAPDPSRPHWGPFDLSGRCAVVTGAGRGIGRGIVRCFVAAGANVLAVDIDDGSASELKELSTSGRGVVDFTQADVSLPETGTLLADCCVDRFGSVDILVNNAGVVPIAPVLRQTIEDFERVIAVNTRGVLFTTQGVARRMIDRGTGGAVVNIASIDGLHPSFPGLAAYGASKAAVLQLTRNLALELAPHAIRVAAISPGPIDTEGAAETSGAARMSPAERSDFVARISAKVPLGRMGMPDDIGHAAVFLASSAAEYITGSNVLVEGGILLG